MVLGVKKMPDELRMRRIILSTLILVPLCLMLAASLSGCQEGTKGTKAPMTQQATVIDSNMPSTAPAVQYTFPVVMQTSVAGPHMTFEETVHDFGDIVPDTDHKTQFKFVNTGNAPLKIVNVRPCCGTVVKGVEDGQVYAPGRGGAVDVEFPAGSQPGSVLRYIYITTNDPSQEIATLTFKAEIVRQVSYEPSSLRLFLRLENGGAGDLTLTSLTGQPFSITSFRSTGDTVVAKFDPAVKDTKFVLKLTANMEKLKQHPRGRVEVMLTHPGCKSVYIDYDVLPEFTVSPPQIMAFNLKPGEPIQKEIWILGNYDNNFEIESVTSKNGTIKLVDQEKVKAAQGPVVGLLNADEADRSKGDHYQYRLKLEIMPPQERTPMMSDTLLVAIKGGDTLAIDYRGYFLGGN